LLSANSAKSLSEKAFLAIFCSVTWIAVAALVHGADPRVDAGPHAGSGVDAGERDGRDNHQQAVGPAGEDRQGRDARRRRRRLSIRG